MASGRVPKTVRILYCLEVIVWDVNWLGPNFYLLFNLYRLLMKFCPHLAQDTITWGSGAFKSRPDQIRAFHLFTIPTMIPSG